MLHIISLGAGVQSTTMALMAAHGEIKPMPDCAIFADTQSEPRAVYDHLHWLCGKNVLPFPVKIVTVGSLFDQIGKQRPTGKYKHQPIPAFTRGNDGRPAPLNRSCTKDFKIVPIEREVRKMLGIYRKRSPTTPIVQQWIGISTDEAHRMKPSRNAWQENRWPLIEAHMSRGDCLLWLKHNGYPRPAKSSCTFCPYHSDKTWGAMKATDPEAWGQAVEIDRRLRDIWPDRADGIYLHRSLKPLDEIDFGSDQFEMFGNECEGVCGV